MSVPGSIKEAVRRWPGAVTEPRFLLPAIALIVLAVVWAATLSLIVAERGAAERAAAVSIRELSETYESQVVRVLRELDHTLRFVKYAYELRGGRAVVQDLKDRSLLPPDLLFVVSVTDAKGVIVDSTRAQPLAPAADPAELRVQHEGEVLRIDRPRVSPGSSQWRLKFSRGLRAPDGGFAGVVQITVDAAHFVSGYESARLGAAGLLAIVGTDGMLLASRSGDSVLFGGPADYTAAVLSYREDGEGAVPSTRVPDGIQRYIRAHALHEFPVAVIVGLSEDEYLAPRRAAMRSYLWKAAAGSVVVILLLAVLERMSRQLALGRLRAIEEQAAHAARVEYLAYHDGFTGLPNRNLFTRLLAQSLRLAHRHDRQLAVLFLDLDHFKDVNDTLGHEAGDQLLQEIAARLKGCLRESDTVARLGGDEFVALLPEIEAEEYVASVARKMTAAVGRPVVLCGRELRITASVGISVYPGDGLDEQALKKSADLAMYRAKAGGGNNFRFYSGRLNASSLERLSLESGLRRAVDRNEFELQYQARRDIASGRITGVEALLRWRHPELGTLAPMQFLPVAEETGLIVPIGKWVLATACRQCAAWRDAGLPGVRMAVNMTGRQLHDENLLADLAAILAQAGLEAHLLELEVPESVLMRDVARALTVVAGLRAMGIRITIDDFGIGYLSLTALRKFPFDSIKIDRSFLRGVASVPGDRALAEAIIAMGRALSLTVVAQGVETKEQADFVRREACNEFQGFYLDRPLPADQVAGLLLVQAGWEGRDSRAAAGA